MYFVSYYEIQKDSVRKQQFCHYILGMDGSDWIRLQRAKALVLGKQSTPNNCTGDYFAERRFGSSQVIFRGVEVKPCCLQSNSLNSNVALTALLSSGGTVGNIMIPTLPDTIVNGPLTQVVSRFLQKLSSSPASFGIDTPSMNLSDSLSILSTMIDVIKNNPNFLDNAKKYIEQIFASSPASLQEQINNDAHAILSTLKDENGTNQIYAMLGSLRSQLGMTGYIKFVEAFSPLIYG